MKIGLSTYSLFRPMRENEMTVLDVIQWTKDNGGKHVEIVPSLGFELENNKELVEEIREKVLELELPISNYAIGANFVGIDADSYEKEIEKVKKHIDIAYRLGATSLRHDVASRPIAETDIMQFESDLPVMVAACQRIADYAAQFNITTNVENHGYYVQASDRINRLVKLVDRENFKTIIDIGNFLCVDENPLNAIKKNLPIASMIHLKDFYYRQANEYPGREWFPTANGNYLRGAIFGNGDISMRMILKTIKEYGYEGYFSIEFEGLEDSKFASKLGMENALRLWEEV